MITKPKITVLGGGSFGTCLANLAACNHHDVTLWMRDHDYAKYCSKTHTNTRYFPDITLHTQLKITSDLENSLCNSHIVIIAVPSHAFRDICNHIKEFISEKVILISATKGIESPSFSLMHTILENIFPANVMGIISGPNFAKEIIKNQFTAAVIATPSDTAAEIVQHVLASRTFHVYRSHDIHGVELGGTLKNIYAIAVGMADALGHGQNTQAMLITRGLAEMRLFSIALGAQELTLLGLSGIGDLVLTSTSHLSRNYRIGYAIGKGKTLDSAISDVGQTAEGVQTLKAVKEKASELTIDMPIVNGLYDILFNDDNITTVIHRLINTTMKDDIPMSN